jgi:hypothetical protein
MVKKLYLDGCSMTYGQGLPRDKSLGHLFSTVGGYTVLDNSRLGKSNLSIVFDAYQNYQNYDIFVLGLTYSSRFGIKYRDKNLDFYAGSHGHGFDLDPETLDIAHQEVYKYFYTVFEHPYCNHLSDMLIDTCISFLHSQGKTVFPFSWESRNVKAEIFYPYLGPKDRLTDGHLNERGTQQLYDMLGNLIEQQG